MTKLVDDRDPIDARVRTEPKNRCRWCGRELPNSEGPGRPRRYCRQGCRQQAHIARKFAELHGLGDDDVIVSRAVLEELQDGLYCLTAALEDVDRDLAVSSEPQDIQEALRWLQRNATDVARIWLEPRAVDSRAAEPEAG